MRKAGLNRRSNSRNRKPRGNNPIQGRQGWHSRPRETAIRISFSAKQIAGIMVFAIVAGLGIGAWIALRPQPQAPVALPSVDNVSVHFELCDSDGGSNCVIDGDTIRIEGEKIRIVGIDTPEVHPPGCPREAELGPRATKRMQALLNEGPFRLEATESSDRDRYGRLLRSITREGRSIGETLISEGLAHSYNGGPKQGWC